MLPSSRSGNHSQSASISVAFPPEQYPNTIDRAMEVFAQFGDIARIDMTLGLATGRLLVTFFDIRAAQQALFVFRDKAEIIPPAAYDFHAVSIAFAEWPSTVTSFRNFGEIAGASICGEDMLVEFYDMRAAQQVFFSVPGCRPWPPQALFHTLKESLARVEYALDAVAATSNGAAQE